MLVKIPFTILGINWFIRKFRMKRAFFCLLNYVSLYEKNCEILLPFTETRLGSVPGRTYVVIDSNGKYSNAFCQNDGLIW